MDLALLVYGVSLLEKVQGFLVFLAVAFGVLTFFFFLFNVVDGKSPFVLRTISNAVACGVLAFLAILIPSEKTAYTMVGAYAAQKIATDPRTQEVGGKVLTIINQKLDSYVDAGIKEAEKQAKKAAGKVTGEGNK
jgi:hypothetical protein